MFTPKEEDLFSEAPREPSVASGISTVSSRLARCRAKAEAAKVRLSYAEKEAEIHQKQAALAAEAKLLQERKNVAAIEAEVEVLTKSMELEPFNMLNIPSLSAKQKTEQYVDFCNNDVKDRPTETKEEVPSNVKRSLRPEAPEFLPPSSKQNDIVQSMFKRDLLLSRLNKFDDNPEYYMVWKATFQSVLDELRVSPREEVDLLLKYLGPNSSRQALIIHSSNPNFPERSLSRIWNRLEERFSAPEIICSSVTRKIENFPKIIKDVERLYDLADIVSEVEGLKEDPKFTSLLSSYDSSTGINVFINKMPYGVQDKWTNAAQTYKRQHHVAYPPFEFFANFVRVQAKERNDPSFMYEPRESRQKSNPKISVKKTEFNVKEPEGKSVSSNSSPMNCLIHKLPHSLNKCNAFKRMSLRERKHMLFVNKVCFKCCESTDHKAEMCNAKVKCGICNVNSHPTALHDYRSQTVSEHSGEKTKTEKEDSGKNCEIKTDNTRIETKCTEVNQNCEFKGKSCAKAVLVRIYKKDNPEHALISYALIDDQSNKSLAKSELFEYFGECGREIEYTMSSCAGDSVHSGRISEGFVVESVLDGKKVELTSLIECNEIPNNWNEIPTPEVCKKFAHLGDLAQLIPPVDRSKHVVVLIGRDAPTAHHVLEQIVGGDQEPFAQKLKLGWVIVGEVCQGALHSSNTINVNKTYILRNDRPSHFKGCNMMLDCKFQTEEALGSSVFERTNNDNKIGQSIEDKRFIEIMNSDFEKNEKGNWSVPLPFRVNCPHRPLPSNYEIARKRAFLLCKSLKKDPEKCEDFCEFMSKMIGNGHAEIAPALHEGEEHWYLPIFGVYHPKKERKIRVVFDSSSKFKGVSLNDVLLSGPDLTNSLLGVLLRFRKYKVAIAADIQQMFFCFYVKPEHRNFLRFMWFRDSDPQKEIIEYRMCVHVFGNSPSPAIATYGLHKTILEGKEEFGEDTCDYVMNNFYVDDGLLSAPSVEMAVDILKRTQNSLKKGGNLILHKIASNKSEVMEAFQQDELASDLKNIHIGEEELPVQRSLGVCWDLVTDTFTFSTTSERKPFTRRGLLSVVNGLYDPLGIAAPIIIQGKIFLRHWISGNDWDEPLPDAFFPVWEKWKSSLSQLSEVHVNRPYGPDKYDDNCKLFVFCDASKDAIAAAAYLKSKDDKDRTLVRFVFGKAKVAPKSGHTIPRLELCSAVLGVEIAELVCEQLSLDISTVKFYSDSQVVLGYICNESRRFYVYVTNRVDRIRKATDPNQWHYISSDANPADQGTRGLQVAQLQDSMWINGSNIMFEENSDSQRNERVEFPLVDPSNDCNIRPEINLCVKKGKIETHSKLGSERFSRFSRWESLLRAVVTLKRKVSEKCHKIDHRTYVQLKKESELVILKEVQKRHFCQEIQYLRNNQKIPRDSKVSKLNPYIDKDGILRVGGRLGMSDLTEVQKRPIILPGSDHVAELLVKFYHSEVQHQGRMFTEGVIRSNGFWITGAKRLIARVLHRCITCKKLRGREESQKMADLPCDRVTPSPPFSHIGLDVFGPWEVVTRKTRGGSANSKRWAVLFTCLSTRAVHIELIEEMSSSSFINALRRFMAIRGPVQLLRSDRGSNFVCGAKELGINSINVEDQKLETFLQNKNITWKFNTPHSSHKGGVWERMIGVSRRILDSMLLNMNHKHLTHEVLSTVMHEVSAIINSRPLVTVSCDPENPSVLSPSLLLTQKSPNLDVRFVDLPVNLKDTYRAQWKCVQYLADTFWNQWKKEYLHTLQSRQKWLNVHRNVQEGDVILLKDIQEHRNRWPMGIVTKVFQGQDGLIRKVEVKVLKNDKPVFYQRPVTELIMLLECDV